MSRAFGLLAIFVLLSHSLVAVRNVKVIVSAAENMSLNAYATDSNDHS